MAHSYNSIGGVNMPKAKPTQVIVHRIELQEKERDMLEAVVAGQTVKNVVVPAAVGTAVVSASYLSYKALKAAYDWGDDFVSQAAKDYETAKVVSGVVVDTTPGPLGNLFRAGRWLFS